MPDDRTGIALLVRQDGRETAARRRLSALSLTTGYCQSVAEGCTGRYRLGSIRLCYAVSRRSGGAVRAGIFGETAARLPHALTGEAAA